MNKISFHILNRIKPRILLVGGGGHARSCIDVIEQENRFRIYGILDSSALQNNVQEILGYPIIGDDSALVSLVKQVNLAFIAIGQIKTHTHRVRIYQTLKTIGYNLPVIISPLAHIANGVKLMEGSIVMHHALINTNARIGIACIINSKALIEHDCIVEDFCHLSTASVINGNCRIGEGSFLGSNMILPHNTRVTPHSILYYNALEHSLKNSIRETSPNIYDHSKCKQASSSIDSNLLRGGDRVYIIFQGYSHPIHCFSTLHTGKVAI